ncbi:MAG: tripartite tricarboxylate transporter substrate-binding protein, partial [Xanthobacteraceae bacterium]
NPDVAPNEMLDNFALAGMLGYSPIILTAAPALSVKDFASLIAMVKAAPGKYSYGSPGPGTPSHVVSAQIVRLFGLDVVHVPYRGGAATLTDVASGTLAWMVNTPNSALPLIDAGKVVPLFVIGARRLKTTPRRADARGTRLSAIYWRGREYLPDGAGRNARPDPRPAQ